MDDHDSSWRAALESGLSDRYRVRQELGGGGMSATFIVEEVALGRTVVLKALPPRLADGLNTERFEREVQVAARLQHAFLVPLLSAGFADGTPWYTMPLVQGESLRARLSREGAMTPNGVARVLRDVAEALAYAHGQGVIHRDIKPDNILLSGAHALVTDFGVAKALAASSSMHPGMTGVGIALGTPAYIAPEQAAGDPSTDHRADLYSLGAMGYEMLVGRPIFGDRPAAQLLAAHLTETPESLAQLAPNAPSDLVGLIEQLIAKHPNDRPSHAQHVADALGAMLSRWSSADLPPARPHVSIGRALALWVASFAGVVGTAWLAVRWLPVPEWTFPAAILVMLAGLPVVALAAWLQRPARPIASVPTVSSTTTIGRFEAVMRPHLTSRRARRGGIIAVAALMLAAAAWAGSRSLGIGPAASLRAQGVVNASDRVLIGDFDSPANDTSLGVVVSDLLRTEVARSQSVQLVGRNAQSITLVAMGRSGDAAVSTKVAPEVAQRTNAKVLLVGAINAVGSGYLLRATLLETSSGRELATFAGSASSADGVIGAVDRLGRDIRDKLGASLREARAEAPLSWAVTPSLDALRQYSEALREGVAGRADEAVRRLENAVAADTEFAMAYRLLASYAQNVGNTDRSDWASQRAFRYRDKLPPTTSDQRLVEATYYSKPSAYDLKRSIATYERILDVNPRSRVALNNLGLQYLNNREPERAIDVFRRNVAIDSVNSFSPSNLVVAYWAAGRTDEARRYVAEKLSRWQPTSPTAGGRAALLLEAEFKQDSAAILLARLTAKKDFAEGINSRDLEIALASIYAVQGRLGSSQATLSRFVPPNSDTVAGVGIAVRARAREAAWLLEKPEVASRLLDSATTAHPPGHATALGYPWLDLAGIYARAGASEKARQLLTEYEQKATPPMMDYNRQQLETARGWLAVAERRYDDAVNAFRAADVGACTVCALAPLAHAYDLANKADSAIAVFERYLSTNDLWRATPDAEFLAGTYKRLGELYEAKGDKQNAARYYARFVDLWKNADPELQPRVAEVRRRLMRLGDSERR